MLSKSSISSIYIVGTKALLRAAETGVPVFAACIRNASSALGCALSRGSRIGLLCSGRKGRPAWDDTLCAGLLLSLLQRQHPGLRLADSARLALLTWQSSRDLRASLSGADHAVFLDRVGYGADIAFACIPNATEAVPELHELPDGDGMRAVDVPGSSSSIRGNGIWKKSCPWPSITPGICWSL